jgi:hypothetical protein
MKLLRNPAVVGLLVVAAIGMLVWNVVLPMFKGTRARPRAVQAAVKSAPVKAAVAVAKKLLPQKVLPKALRATNPVPAAMDLVTVETNAVRWTLSPRRDPFNSRISAASQAARLLKLKGIWRQTGHDLAVINKKLVAEGDPILEFTVEKIEPDRVWVTGPGGREALDFRLPTPDAMSSRTNAALEAVPGP